MTNLNKGGLNKQRSFQRAGVGSHVPQGGPSANLPIPGAVLGMFEKPYTRTMRVGQMPSVVAPTGGRSLFSPQSNLPGSQLPTKSRAARNRQIRQSRVGPDADSFAFPQGPVGARILRVLENWGLR